MKEIRIPSLDSESQHINYALVEETRPMMYRALKYWGKKPHNIFRKYIETYSKNDEIALDAFVGSGITVFEALQSNRKAIGIDLNPISIFLMEQIARPLDFKNFNIHFDEIINKLEKEEQKSGFFVTKCKKCGQKARIINIHWDKENIMQIRYNCPCSKKNQSKKPEDFDIKLSKDSEKITIPWWYPQDKFPLMKPFDPARKYVGEHYYNLWTRRSLYLLSYLYNEIENIKDDRIREAMKYAFISMLHLTTKMPSARREKSKRPDSGSWGRPAYIFPARHLEMNPVVSFHRAVLDRQGIIKAKESSDKLLKDKIKLAKDFDELKNNKNCLLIKGNALELTKFIPENSVDYIITDPPYGGLIQYFALSSIWSVWLKSKSQNAYFEMDYADEITIDEKKNFDYYHNMLTKALKELFKVLKPGRYLTLTFHNREINVWNSALKAGAYSGFIFEKIIYQPNRRASEAGVAMPYGSAISDYYLRFRKPLISEKIENKKIESSIFPNIVLKAAKDIIIQRGEPTEITFILNGIYVELLSHGEYFEGDNEEIINILKKNIDKEFVLIENKENAKLGFKWWLKDPQSILHKGVPLSDRIERVIIDILKRNIKVTYDEVLKEIFVKFANGLTPDSKRILDILKEYAEKAGEGKWRYKAQAKLRESQHSQLIFYLSKLGINSGFKIWIGSKEQGEQFEGIRLKDLSSKDLDVDNLTSRQISRLKDVDVIWHKEGSVGYLFEVENTTSITSALERGSNIPNNYRCKKIIVLPNERKGFLIRKLNEPMFKDNFEKYSWSIIYYDEIINFYRLYKNKNIPTNKIDTIIKEGK